MASLLDSFTPGFRLIDGTALNTLIGNVNNFLTGVSQLALSATQIQLDTGTKTATAVAGAATLNKMAGVVTSEALTTAAGAQYTLTLTNSDIDVVDQVFVSVAMGTATTGTPAVTTVKPAAGSVVIVVQNIASAAALNGTIKLAFMVLKN